MTNHSMPKNDCHRRRRPRQAIITLEIASVTELSSAQQRMSVLDVSRIRIRPLHNNNGTIGEGDGDSDDGHQQYQYEQKPNEQGNGQNNDNDIGTLLSFPISWCASTTDADDQTEPYYPMPLLFVRLVNALRQGKNRLVLREWRQGACWWNLNMNHYHGYADGDGDGHGYEVENKVRGSAHHHRNSKPDTDTSSSLSSSLSCSPCLQPLMCEANSAQHSTISMARAEVAGYRLARFAMDMDSSSHHQHNYNYEITNTTTTTTIMDISDNFSDEVKRSDEQKCNHQNNNGNCAKDSSRSMGERKGVLLFTPEVLYFSHDDDYGNFLSPLPSPPLGLNNALMQPKCRENINNNDDGEETCNNTPWALMSFFDNNEMICDADNEFETIQQKLDVVIDSGMSSSSGVNLFNNDNNTMASLSSEQQQQQHPPIQNATNNSNSNTRPSTKMMGNGDGRDNGRNIIIPCLHFPTTMTKIRHEFGFIEPHPRHGRVPMEECLDYAMMILRDVIMPIQSSFFMLGTAKEEEEEVAGRQDSNPYHREDSIICDKNKDDVMDNLLSVGLQSTGQVNNGKVGVEPFQYHDMIAVYRHALHRLSLTHEMPETNDKTDDDRVNFLLRMLDECVDALDREWEESDGKSPPLPPVLCHMDLQPQNLAFGHGGDQHQSGHHNSNNAKQAQDQTTHSANDCSVVAVMDWEEACYADPRFELLLVCRKVLANREQAEKLWQSYSNRVQQLGTSLLSSKSRKCYLQLEVGPLEPWLKLETVHSLCTLLMQAMDLLGGGRTPWETKPDLWGKIDRERQRLVEMGWLFCDHVEEVQ